MAEPIGALPFFINQICSNDGYLMNFALRLQTGAAPRKPFAQKMGATVHWQGKLTANLLDEIALTFLF